MQAHDVLSAPSCTIASNFKPFLLLLFLFVGVWGYGQNPAQTITKADKFKSHTVLTEKLDQKSLRKNSRGATQDINNKVVPKERKKSGVGETVYGPIQTNRQESPLEALKGKKEDLSKRDMSSKHFINDDGTYTALIGGGPIHYDKNGTWEDISHTITANSNQQYPYSNTTNLLESYFGASAHLGVMSKTKEGEVKEFLNTKMYWEVNGQVVSMQDSNNATVTIDGDKAYYNNLFGAIAAEYSVLSGKRKLNYIIPNAEALGNIPENAEYLVFSEDIVLPDGWKHIVDKRKGVLVNDTSGETIYAYENPTVYEDYHGELAMPEKDNPATFEIKKTNNTITLFLKVKTSWLQDAARIFPLAIDPTATVYPDNASLWTGEAYSDGDEYSGNLFVGRFQTSQYLRLAGFARFNLTSIPTSSTISNVRGYVFKFAVYNPNNRTYGSWSFRNCEDPLITFGIEPTMTTNFSSALNDLGGTNGWRNNVLNANGITYLQNALVNGFVALGVFPRSNWFDDTYYVGFRGYDNSNRPYLSITYTAPPVPNDNCSGAISLIPSADNTCNATTGTTVGATQSTQASSCSGNRDDDVWYSFVATSTNHDILATTPGSGSGGINDIVFEVFTSSGTCGTLVSLGCIDGTSGAGDEGAILTGATIGNTYYIRLYSYSVNGNQGVFNICVTTPVITTCEPTTDSPSESYINDVRFVGTLNDVSTLNSGYSNGYQDWTGEPKAIQAQGEGVNIIADAGGTRGGWKAWVDWNQDGNFDVGEEVYAPTGSIGKGAVFGFVIPPNQPIGDYTMRIRIGINFWDSNGNGVFDLNEDFYYDFNSCEDFINTTFIGDADHYFGEAEDYKFTVIEKCESYVANTIDNERCGTGTLNLDVTGTGAAGVTGFNFYSAKTGGALIGNQAAISNAATWTTPSISTTTTYWVTATNGTCESTVRVHVRATINNTPADITFTPAAPILCGEDTIVEVNANSGTIEEFLIDEEFNSGLGVFSSINNDTNTAAVKAITRWQHQTSTLIPTGGNVWKPAIASGINNNGFAMATSDHNLSPKRQVDNSLTLTNSVNSTDFTSLFLNFDMFYLRYWEDDIIVPGLPEYVNIDISTNGGGAWITLETIRADYGYGSNFLNKNIDLIAYINQPDLKIRIRHVSYADGSSGWLPDGIAVDNIKLFGEKTVSDFEWDIPGVDVYTNPTADIAYTPGTLLQTVYIRPTLLQLETNPFTITANTGGSAACPSSGHLTLINNTKIYKSAFNDWNDDTNWSPPGVPTIDNCVIIPNGQESSVDGTLLHAEAKNVTVKNGGILHLEPEYTLTVQDWINVENTGIFNIKNSASLIQINGLTTKPNSGNVHVQRAPKNDFSPVGNLNYVYWSSPVKNFNVRDISPNTSANLIWKWIPTISGNGSGDHGDWQNATGTMLDGTGYIVRGLSGAPTVLPATSIPVSNNTALFTGVPNNGEIVVPINRGNYTAGDYSGIGNTATAQDDNWNLLGNPYPSSISANAFVNLNTHISGTLYLWPHTALPSAANDDPFYGDYGLNYDNIYIEHNPTGTIPPTVGDLNIASGQAFMVLMMDTAGLNETVLFNNSLRDKIQANNGFYRLENTTAEKHRIWLDFSGSDNKAHTLLVGYIENATNEYDRLYDGYNFVNNPTNFYSLIEESSFSIQGRAWPFLTADTVPLGFTITTSDIYKIGINSLDGLFANDSQDIFLEDIYLGTIHNLRSAPYSFNSGPGSFNDRFVLRYTNDALSIPEEIVLNGLLISAPKNNYIKVVSSKDLIKTIEVYDILGRVLFTNKNIQQSEVSITELKTDAGTFIVKVTLANGLQKTQKVVLK